MKVYHIRALNINHRNKNVATVEGGYVLSLNIGEHHVYYAEYIDHAQKSDVMLIGWVKDIKTAKVFQTKGEINYIIDAFNEEDV
jgi:hypothetical protein